MVTEPSLIKANLLFTLTEKNDEIVLLDSLITRINSSSKVSHFIPPNNYTFFLSTHRVLFWLFKLYRYYNSCADDRRKNIPRNVMINRGAAKVDNYISRDDIFDYHPSRKCNIYFIIQNRTLDPLLFSELLLLLNIPTMVRGDPKGKY